MSMSSSSATTAGRTARAAHDAHAVPDPQLVADAKHEINALVQEIAQLAAEDLAPEEFFRGFLDRIVSAMAAFGGAVWLRGEGGALKSPYSVNAAQAGIEAPPPARTRHGLLLKRVLDSTQAVVAQPQSGQAADGGSGNPTEYLLVLAPLIVEREAIGLVEVFQRAGVSASTQRGYLRFVVQMAELASGYLKSRRLRQLEENQSLWRQLEALVAALHGSLDVQETAYAIVNDGRRMIGCDRVSLALRNGPRCEITAVSGLDAVDRRAAEVERLARLADAVIEAREPLWSEAGDDDLPPQLDAPLQAYVDKSHARLVAVLPLFPRPKTSPAEAIGDSGSGSASGGSKENQPPLGALIVEQLHAARATETLRSRAQIVAHHSAAALANALEHSTVLLLPLWKMLGRLTLLFRGRALPKTLLVIVAVAGSIAALIIVPTDFEVAARGKLQPAERREVFAPLDGVIAQVPVEHGQIVEAGAVLAELTNTDLDLQLAELLGRQSTNQQRLTALQRALLDTKGGAARLPLTEENRIAGEMLQLRQEAQSIERELKLVREKQQQQTLLAPQRGQVVTWKVRDLLLHRPVSRGQSLLTLANPDGPWELELYLPERRLAQVQRGQAASGAENSLDVEFALSSHPGQTFHGRVAEVEQAAEVRGDEGNTVLVRVTVEKAELPPLHEQTTVTAKIACGRTSIGYAWFCDFVETVQGKVLFWLPS
jgi:multidrug efflux pump subunit AcrA (membrane-fusion protein)